MLHLIRHEVVRGRREDNHHIGRIGLSLLAFLALVMGLAQSRPQSGNIGAQALPWLGNLLLAAMGIFGALAGARSMLRERHERTLGVLLLSGTRPDQIIGGKLVATTLRIGAIGAAAVPLLLLPMGLGGVGWRAFALFVLLSAATLALAVSLGVAVAAVASTDLLAHVALTICLVAIYLFLPVVLPSVLDGYASPFVALHGLLVADMATELLAHCAMALALVPILLRLASRAVDRAANPGTHPATHALPKWPCGGPPRCFQARLMSLLRIPRLAGNPVAWKDLHYHYGGQRVWWVLCILVHVGLWGWFAVSSWRQGAAAWGFHFTVEMGETVFLLALATLLIAITAIAVRASRAFRRERQDASLDLLLLSDLEPGELVRGKFIAMARSLAPLLLSVAVFEILASVHLGKGMWEPSEVALSCVYRIVVAMALCFGVAMMGMFFSLVSHPRATWAGMLAVGLGLLPVLFAIRYPSLVELLNYSLALGPEARPLHAGLMIVSLLAPLGLGGYFFHRLKSELGSDAVEPTVP